jgi:hypothetical protein
VEPRFSDHQKLLRSRVQQVYEGSSFYSAAYSAASNLARQGQSVGVLDYSVITRDDPTGMMGDGDNTQTAEVGFSNRSDPRTDSNSGFDSSPWRHSGAGSGTYEQAYRGRANAYMGRPLR